MGDHAAQNFRRLHTRHAEHPRRGGAHAAHRHIAGQAIPHVPRHQHAFRRPWAERIRRHASVAQPDDQRRLHVGGQHAAERLRQFRRQRAPRFQRNRHRLFASQRDIGSHRPAQLLRALLVFHLHHRARQAVFAQRAAAASTAKSVHFALIASPPLFLSRRLCRAWKKYADNLYAVSCYAAPVRPQVRAASSIIAVITTVIAYTIDFILTSF